LPAFGLSASETASNPELVGCARVAAWTWRAKQKKSAVPMMPVWALTEGSMFEFSRLSSDLLLNGVLYRAAPVTLP
jgi:hypothetical protein